VVGLRHQEDQQRLQAGEVALLGGPCAVDQCRAPGRCSMAAPQPQQLGELLLKLGQTQPLALGRQL
jgi:hypothetical protein